MAFCVSSAIIQNYRAKITKKLLKMAQIESNMASILPKRGEKVFIVATHHYIHE
jgi:hypothetical protein